MFIVCTPELASLKLAQRRCQELASKNVEAERTRFVLNRWQKGEVGMNDVESFLRLPILAVIPNDYMAVRTAMVEGRELPESAPIARTFNEFATMLTGSGAPEKLIEGFAKRVSRLFRKS